jgi:streptogramin lyase
MIGRVRPNRSFAEFFVPTSGTRLANIAVDRNGALWFTEEHGNDIGRIDTPGMPP